MEQDQGQASPASGDVARPASPMPLRRAWPALAACGLFAIACAGAASLGSTTAASQRTVAQQASGAAQARKTASRTNDFAPPAPMTMEEALANSIAPTTDDGACADCNPFAATADGRAVGSQTVASRLAAPVQQEWEYDALGNITFNTHRGIYHYEDAAHPMRVTKVTGGGVGTTRVYEYDAVGNQTGRSGAKVVYNERNLPARLLRPDGTIATSFLYGPGGERVRKTTSTGSITSVRGLYERHRDGANIEHRLIVPGIAILSYKQSGSAVVRQPERYVHTDHLGSTIAITSDDDPGTGLKAKVKEVRSYDAFGLTRNPDWKSGGYAGVAPALSVQGYTGHNDDAELGLIDMKGRVYDPLLGRFLSADPLVSDPSATQPWHPYAYVDNNPLRDTDPSGYLKCVAMRVSGHGTWVCATGGGDGGGEPGKYIDIRTGDRVVDVNVSGGKADRNEGPDGHPASDRELANLEEYDEDPIRQSGQHVQHGSSGGTAPHTASPGFDGGSGLSDADVDAICRESGTCADEVTVVGQASAAPDAASGMYRPVVCDSSDASCMPSATECDLRNASCVLDSGEPFVITPEMEQEYIEEYAWNGMTESDESLRVGALKEWDRWSVAEKQRFLRDPSKIPHENWYKPNMQQELHRIREEAGNGGIYRPLETLIPQPRFPKSPYNDKNWKLPDPDAPRPPVSI
jgi:RHS repeat-associated protein